ncbi:hypothetical protein ACP275_14G193600 [Erythranthe tilingii]
MIPVLRLVDAWLSIIPVLLHDDLRYCVAVNVIGFAYSGFQAFDLGYNLGTGKRVISHHLHYHFDFAMDQGWQTGTGLTGF